MRGQRIVRITGELLTDMMRQGWRVPYRDRLAVECRVGLPADADLVDCWWDGATSTAVLKFESAQWEPTLRGEPLPDVTVQYVAIQAEHEVPA